VAANAIVEDIVGLVESYFADASHLQVGQMLWVAPVKGQNQFYGRNINNTKKKIIKLTVFAEEDIEKLGAKEVSYREIRISRAVRWIKEANQQGACLTQEDLSALVPASVSLLSQELKNYQSRTKSLLPLRGYIEDIGRGTTHKKQIIGLYLQNHLTPEIARMTSHSKDAVDRYVNDFQIISMLSKKFDKEIIPVLARKSKTLVKEYLKICGNYQKKDSSKLPSVGVI